MDLHVILSLCFHRVNHDMHRYGLSNSVNLLQYSALEHCSMLRIEDHKERHVIGGFCCLPEKMAATGYLHTHFQRPVVTSFEYKVQEDVFYNIRGIEWEANSSESYRGTVSPDYCSLDYGVCREPRNFYIQIHQRTRQCIIA